MKIKTFRKLVFLSITLFLFALGQGCSDTIPGSLDIRGNIPTYQYHLLLSIRNDSGVDFIKGITPDILISSDMYQWKILSKPTERAIVPNDLIVFPLDDDYEYLYFDVLAFRSRMNSLTFQLTCPYIFGDNVAHTILSLWKHSEDRKFQPDCYHIEVDGAAISPTQYTLYTNTKAYSSVLTLSPN